MIDSVGDDNIWDPEAHIIADNLVENLFVQFYIPRFAFNNKYRLTIPVLIVEGLS